MQSDAYESVTDLDSLREAGREIVSARGKAVVLFHHDGEVYAVDNRCPHMGFPLSDGSVEDGILTCHWHHARFELSCGDTFDIWADDVQTYPTEVRDGEVYIDPDPDPDVPPETYWRDRLVDGMSENISLVMAKGVINLDDLGEGFTTPLETALEFGVSYRAMGWGRGLTTLGTMANLYDWVDHAEKRRAMYVGVREVASECAGEPPRFEQYGLGTEEPTKERLKGWFRENCEVRDSDGAERCIRTAAALLPPEEVVEILLAAATDHLYMNSSHTLDFLNKACETLDHVGWDRAETVLGSTVDQLTNGSRAEEQSQWRQPVDVASLVFDAHDALPELVAAGEGRSWSPPARAGAGSGPRDSSRRCSPTTPRRSSTRCGTQSRRGPPPSNSPTPSPTLRRAGSHSSAPATSSTTGTPSTTPSATPTPPTNSPDGPTRSRPTGRRSTAR